MIILFILLLAAGFAGLIKGADLFVDGSSSLAGIFKVPKVIIGLTIVAMGTSAPELAVSTSAALQGANEIALSNVVGSNIFNLLCVLGICAMIHPVPVDRIILKRDMPIALIAAVLLLVMTGGNRLLRGQLFTGRMTDTAGIIGRGSGIVLLVLFIVYIAYLIKKAGQDKEKEMNDEPMSAPKSLLLIAIGIMLITGGGQAVVYSARQLAGIMGMSETLIGLTIVAVGTSLPELVTSIVASRKGENGLAVGNVVGSNIFNILFILGISTTIHPIAVNVASIYDICILIAVSLIVLGLSCKDHVISRLNGGFMAALYIADVVFAIVR